jgi:hypothetical protein
LNQIAGIYSRRPVDALLVDESPIAAVEVDYGKLVGVYGIANYLGVLTAYEVVAVGIVFYGV